MPELGTNGSEIAQKHCEDIQAEDKASMAKFREAMAVANAAAEFRSYGPELTGEAGGITLSEYFKQHPELLQRLGVEITEL